MELYLGTGGYSNDDWVGLLYPPEVKKSDWLRVYAEKFNAVELNASFYAIPGVKAFRGMLEKSGGRVRFAVKLHQSMTHARDADDTMYTRMLESVAPLREAGVLGPFLAQFPYSFHRTAENRQYLLELVEHFEGERLTLEFRHESWNQLEVRQSIASFGLVWTSVDYPPLRGLPGPDLHSSAGMIYLRLHGRNKSTWWDGKSAAERHDYLYSADELRPFLLRIAELQDDLEQVWLLFLNTTKGHALKNLAMVRELASELGLAEQ
ncbi:MAG: DUF72 domain-containing protein [Deinococcota bacterium]|jgi:uncharacterized protein YecE (DUF72 family)|nr:DUF72 domain-containing protein [Deinococcota bacterium]